VNPAVVKVSIAVAVFAAAVVLAIRNAGGDEGTTKAFFYDLSEHRLYSAPGDSAPPLAGTGGAPDDGVRATLIVPRGQEQDESKRVIAFFETFTPELKKLVEDRRAAIARGEAGPSLDDRNFLALNTLVRLPEDGAAWHPESSKEGQEIMVAWMNRPSPDGKGWVVCRP
jgi:hypothetical protein